MRALVILASIVTSVALADDARRVPPRVPPRGGTIAAEDVSRVVNVHREQIYRCYARQLEHDRELRGRLTIDFRITPSGQTRAARVRRDTLRDPRVASCVLRIVRRMRFPRPQGGPVRITYPFVFQPPT